VRPWTRDGLAHLRGTLTPHLPEQAMADRVVSPERLMQFWFGFAPPLMLEAAVGYRVFDVLGNSPKTVAEMSAATRASGRGLRALLDGLVGLELLAKSGDVYALTPESEAFLVSGKTTFRGGMFRHVSRQLIPHWVRLADAVRTGKPAVAVNQEKIGAEFFRQ